VAIGAAPGTPLGGAMQQSDVLPSFVAELPLTREALAFAEQAHGDQRRESDRARYILHPLEVASLLSNTGADDEVVAAAVLHDAVERTGAELAEIERRFGKRVAALVAALTEDQRIDRYDERKHNLRERVAAAGPDALAIYAADKVAKVRELRAQIDHARRGEETASPDLDRKLEHYRRSLELLERELPDHPLVRQLRFELEALQLLPPGGEPTRPLGEQRS
jgi:(p)ppGpp synthase/HD superfamily hydrolase